MGQRFVRADSISVYYINPFTGQDQPALRLDGQVGDSTWLGWGPFAFVRLARIDTVTIFGFPQRVLTFELDGLAFAVMKLCKKFGPMTEWRYSDPPAPWPEWGRELVGCTIDTVGYGNTLGVAENDYLPLSFELYQNFPNPFNPATVMRYQLPVTSYVELKVYNVLGQKVATLVNEVKQPGNHEVMWDANGMSSGVYFSRFTAGRFVETKKLILLR